nr:hypothetical protein [Tanacetum cinerariifolium]
DEFDAPVSFVELPIRWSNRESSYDNKNRIYLRGTIDNGLQRKAEASSSSLWNNLCEVFRPFEDDLIHHLYFIGEAVKRDETLQKSKFLASFLDGKRRKKKAFDPNDEIIFKPSFLVDDVKDTNELTTKEAIYNESESKDEDDMNDTVCAICDNGGDLTWAFHATVEFAEAVAESKCISLGMPAKKVKGSQPFVCLNCTHEIHQCFACGELGSSNKSSGAEEENKKVKDLQFAVCRRCPKSYHRKCLPRKHEIDLELHTPVRNIKFPEINHANKKVLDNEEVSHSDYTSNEIRVGKTSSSVVRSCGRSSTVMENWKNNNTAVSQQHGHIYKVQEPLLSKNVEAFDLPVENPKILSEKAIGQTTEKAENQK